jgi:hypothetical protein
MVSRSAPARGLVHPGAGRLRLPAFGTVIGALMATPRIALACPSCAGNPDGGVARYLLIGLMVAAPYVAATVVIRFVRKGEAEMRARQSNMKNESAGRTAYGAGVGS